MNAKTESDLTPSSRTHVERKSDREIIVRRTFDGPRASYSRRGASPIY